MPSEPLRDEIDALLKRVEQLADDGVGAERAEPLLERVAVLAEPGGEVWGLAHRELARHAVETRPWRASVLARRVIDADPGDHLAWGLLALAQSLLGNHDYAVVAYRRALRLAPDNPWYLHNLGHLYDVALDQPEQAVTLLRRAARRLPDDAHVLASLAHALARSGDPEQGRALMRPVVRRPAPREHHALYSWLLDASDRALTQRVAESEATLPSRRARRRRRTRG